MASNPVENDFDNEYMLDFTQALTLVKNFFSTELPSFSLTNEYQENTGYWGIKYTFEETIVFISCGRGFLENEITLNGKEVSLIQFDARMKNIKTASEKNILFTLQVIKRFLSSHQK